MKNNLVKVLEDKGMSQAELARCLDLTRPTIHTLANGGNPTLKNAYKIAKVLGVSVYDIWIDETKVVEQTIIVRRVV